MYRELILMLILIFCHQHIILTKIKEFLATVIGAPQVHNRRSISNFYDSVNLSTFRCPVDDSIDNLSRGIKFNLDGECCKWGRIFLRKNFYHKPKAFINHYWNFSQYTKLKTAAYVSLGNGGGTSAEDVDFKIKMLKVLVGMIHFKDLE